jgi:hypothetical protein
MNWIECKAELSLGRVSGLFPARRMRAIHAAAVLSILLAGPCIAAGPLSVTISESSICVNGFELRSGPRGANGRYISLTAAEKVLGQPQDTYVAGLGVRVYAWRDAGIDMQRGFRGSDKGKIFKFQVWFGDTYDKDKNKHSGKFSGHVRVGGLDITPDTTFDSIRSELEKAGFEITEDSNVISAKKGEITIFTVETTNKIQRIEAWCS